MSRSLLVLLLAASLLVLLLVLADLSPLLRGPAPYPPEWQWGHAPKFPSVRLWLPLAALAGLLALLRWPFRFVLIPAVALGWAFQLTVLNLEPAGAAAELARRTASSSFTSYHTVAATGPGRDPARFLAEHDRLLPALRKGTLHAATHPPGPVLYYRALLDLCALAPGLVSALDSLLAPEELPHLPPPARAAALLGGALFGLLGVFAAWPTALLAQTLGADVPSARRAGILWTLVPGLVLMAPELDQALSLPVAGAVTCLGLASRIEAPWRATRMAASAGALAGLALFFSYGAALLVALGGAALLPPVPRARWPRLLLPAVLAAATVFLLPQALGHDSLASLRTGLAIHREQFTARRSYATWLAFNPWDLFLFLGPPVALLWLLRGGRALRALARRRPLPAAETFAGGLLAVVAVLILSGLVRGEMGRILVPLMPVVLVGALGGERMTAGPSVLLAALLAATDLTLRLCWQLP